MITSILEYRFSNHYFNDIDNRFKLRVKDVNILNNFENKEQAMIRFRMVMYNFLLTQLDKMETRNGKDRNYGLIFGEVVFINNDKIEPAQLKADNNVGNLYVCIIKNDTVVTLLLLKNTLTNEEILSQLNAHENRNPNGIKITSIKNMNGIDLSMDSKSRPKITINLDMPDSEFFTKYNSPILINNKYNSNSFSVEDAEKMSNIVKKYINDKPIMTGHALTADMKAIVQEKEWVINKGSTILVRYPDGIKPKTIDEIIIDDKSSPRKFILRFKNTAKLYPLNIDSNFISSPKQQTETYNKLIDAFDLDPKADFNFEGPIKRFMDYTKRNGSIGIVIEPKSIVY